jgi:hypothetical protein
MQDILNFQFAGTTHIIKTVNKTITNTHGLHGNILLRHSKINIHRPIVGSESSDITGKAAIRSRIIAPLARELRRIARSSEMTLGDHKSS